MYFRERDHWALILGGSSGIGLAAARKLASWGMNLFVVHRDLKGTCTRVEREFAEIRAFGSGFESFNENALTSVGRTSILDKIDQRIGPGKVRLLLHSVASGNLKLFAPIEPVPIECMSQLSESLGVSTVELQSRIDRLFNDGAVALVGLASRPVHNKEAAATEEDLAQTIYSMGTSLLSWVQAMHDRRLFTADARVLGLTSEGSTRAWRGYGAIAAAKAALEAVARSISLEYAPHGIRCNILQPGVTDTPALRLIPGSLQLKANAQHRNPFSRLTRPEDVANVIALMCTDEAAWINGSIIRVDGGEYITG